MPIEPVPSSSASANGCSSKSVLGQDTILSDTYVEALEIVCRGHVSWYSIGEVGSGMAEGSCIPIWFDIDLLVVCEVEVLEEKTLSLT